MVKLHYKQVENITFVSALHSHHTRQAKNNNYFLSNTFTSQCSNGLSGMSFQIPSDLKLGYLYSVD